MPTSPKLRRLKVAVGYELSARLRVGAYGGEPEGYGLQADG